MPLASAQSQPSVEVKHYENAEYGIALSYPSDWQLEPDFNLPPGGIVGFVSPTENEEEDFHDENFEILYNNLPAGTTLDSYTDTLIHRYQDTLANFTIIDSSVTSISNSSIPSHKLVFRFTDGDFNFKVLNTWSVIGEKALITIYYAEPQEDYETFLPSVEKMLGSLQVNPAVFGKPEPAGRYVIPALGFEAEIPHDWVSIPTGSINSTLFKASPATIASSNSTERVVMFLVQQLEGQNDIASHFKNNSDNDFNCGTSLIAASIVELNEGIKALESELECSDEMTTSKIKYYLVSGQGVIIFIGYGASSDVAYEKYIADFEESVRGLQLSGATDLSDPYEYASILGLRIEESQVAINGTLHSLRYASNSQLTDIELDEESKKLSFSFQAASEGYNETEINNGEASNKSQLLINIGDILRGPYAVSIDDEIINGREDNRPHVLAIDDETSESGGYLIFTFNTGKQVEKPMHEIAIVGTSVIPEFEIGIPMLILASFFALPIIYSFLASKRIRAFFRSLPLSAAPK